MSPPQPGFHERDPYSTPIRDLGLQIAGSRLEPLLEEFEAELKQAGVRRVRPHFYLSTEWGVVPDTVAIAIPFYLARPDLTALQAEYVGHVEGFNRTDILRYLRHEMGHVVNYAYRLYEEEDWITHFGSITQPYLEDYRPEPFSQRYVRHLPGWYAQKHPEEDWAETFAVWMTPRLDWRAEYSDWPEALAKLAYCDRTMQALAERDPLVTTAAVDEEVSQLTYSVEEYYQQHPGIATQLPRGLDGALRTIFEDFAVPEDAPADLPRKPAAELIRRFERDPCSDTLRSGPMPFSRSIPSLSRLRSSWR
jgi:hypothetical protein